MKRITSVLVLAFFMLPALFIGAYGIFYDGKIEDGESSYSYVERMTKETLLLSDNIREIAPKLLYRLSPSQRDGIFITLDYLLEDVKIGDFSAENSRTVKKFAEVSSIPTYFAIVPTSIAIKQQELPKRAAIFNQKRLIEECYKMAGGDVRGVDCYSELFAVRDQYLYYRTENLNTSLGGYYIYRAVMKEMRETPMEIDEFSVFHRQDKIMGSLAQRVALKGIEGDLTSIYEHQSSRAYSVVHRNNKKTKKYYSLYPKGFFEDGFVTINGGHSPYIDINSSGGRFGSLLIIGDKNALSVLPFLAVDFRHVTFIDPSSIDNSDLYDLKLQNYDRAVFCFDARTVTNDINLGKAFLSYEENK